MRHEPHQVSLNQSTHLPVKGNIRFPALDHGRDEEPDYAGISYLHFTKPLLKAQGPTLTQFLLNVNNFRQLQNTIETYVIIVISD